MPRSPEHLRHQLAILERALRSVFSPDDATALAPGGPLVGGTSRAAPGNARFTLVVHARLSDPTIPQHIRVGLPHAFATLTTRQYTILRWFYYYDQQIKTIAFVARCHPRTITRQRIRALEDLARQLWTDQGEPRVPDPPEKAPPDEGASGI